MSALFLQIFVPQQQNFVGLYKTLWMGVRQKMSFANKNYRPQDKPFSINLLTDLST